jgi:hypothetical protein
MYLQLILDNKFFKKVVKETYQARHVKLSKQKETINEADTNINTKNTPSKKKVMRRSHKMKWKNLTVSKFKKFLGLFYWMGLVRLPDMGDHWLMEYIFKNLEF